MRINVTIPHQPTRPPASRRQDRPALNDLHDMLKLLAKDILQAEKTRKELEKELRLARHTSCHVNNRDLIRYLSSYTDVVEHAIYEWFGENPKGKINRESFERQMGTAHINPIINRTFFKRKPEYRQLESLKEANPTIISHEGIGLDEAARSIMSEHLNSDSAHDESEIIEAICNFIIKYPQAGRGFRREVRNLIEQEKSSEHHEFISDLETSLKTIVSEIEEKYKFGQLLLKEGLRSNIRIKIMPISAIWHKIPLEKNPGVRAEMLRGLHAINSHLAFT